MYTLGLSFDYHDAAAALLQNGEVIAAAQEERFTRRKNDASMPVQAMAFCLQHAGISADQLAAVVFYEKPLLKFERILKSSWDRWPESRNYLTAAFQGWIAKGKFDPIGRIAEHLRIPRHRVHLVQHHQAHAGSAFYCSPFEQAAVITLDGVGEYETLSIAYGEGTRITRLASQRLPHSLGLLYSAFTAYLGFKVNEDEYKVMGMAGFGQPQQADAMREWLRLREDGTFVLRDLELFNFTCPENLPYTPKLVERFGPPRSAESPFRTQPVTDSPEEHRLVESCRYYADLAASLQRVAEDTMLHVVKTAMARTGCRDVCMAGGVALNSLANGRIKRELGCRLFVQPAAGDAGGALGAALTHYYQRQPERRLTPLRNPYLGAAFSETDIRHALTQSFTRQSECVTDRQALLTQVASALREGKIVGWAQGRFEWGPRALGARSILADPTHPQMQAIVNEKIKFREPFRPFAPAVLRERAQEFFEIGDVHSASDPEFFMLSVCNVRPEMRSVIPAVTHVDGTARVQLVDRETSPLYYDLIAEFGRQSGVPVILNTSFNRRGEPIVNTPLDAIMTFEWSDLDRLVLGNFIISKDLLT